MANEWKDRLFVELSGQRASLNTTDHSCKKLELLYNSALAGQ